MKKRTKKPFKILVILTILLISINFFATTKEEKYTANGIEETEIKNLKPSIKNIEADENLEPIEKLKLLENYEPRLKTILKNYNRYPELLLKMLSRNLEMIDFVLEYPEKYGTVYSGDVGDIKDGTIPLFIQWDKRWGYGKYGDSSIAISGCGPTALSMVVVGLTKDPTITPYKVGEFAEKNGYYLKNVGTSWELITKGATHFGIKSKEISLNKNNIVNALENHHPIICSVKKGDFTTTGHFIVLVGIEDGKIKVNDPNSIERSNTLWTYEKLEPQIKNLWEFSN